MFLQEGTHVNTLIYQFTATDPNGDSLTYHTTNIPSSLTLTSNGELIVHEDIDRETHNQLLFVVMVTDGNAQVQVNVTLIILDVNDNQPVFSEESYQVTIEEDQPPGTLITMVTATDKDEGSNGAITHSLIGTDEDTYYIVVSPNGCVLLRYPLDYEQVQSITVIIRATDNGSPQQYSSDTLLTINIINVPDRVPVFMETSYSLVFNYPISRGTPLVTIQALTEDNTTHVTYALTGTNLFVVDEFSGQLSILDDVISVEGGVVSHQFSVTAMNGDVQSTVPIVINVTGAVIIPTIITNSFFVAELPVFLPDELFLGELALSTGLSQSTLYLMPSQYRSEDYFKLDNNRLIMLPTVTGRVHKLNISIISGDEQNWFDEIEVHVSLLTNDSLRHHVTFLLPNFNPVNINSHFLNNLLYSVSTRLSCSVNQLQLVSVQGTTKGTELVLLVLQPHLLSHIPRENYLYKLLANIDKLSQDISWSIMIPDNDQCKGTCTNYQQCTTTLFLFSPRGTIITDTVSITSRPFGIQSSCVCPDGFDPSDNCASEINECDPNPCLFNGVCHNLVNRYKCDCPSFTSGTNCSIVCPSLSCELCSSNPCHNGGECKVDAKGNQTCSSCPDGYTGPLCELTTASFHGDGYIEVSSPVIKTNMSVIFTFATVTPNSILVYTG